MMCVCNKCDAEHTIQEAARLGRCRVCGKKGFTPAPSTNDITRECAVIRTTWSERVEESRRTCIPEELDVTRIHCHPRGRRVSRGSNE
jgi:hypothetical protein